MNKKETKYRSNKWKIALSMITSDSSFIIGIFVVYMLLIGLSLAEVSIVISGYLIFSSIGQIPSGIFADRHGYKNAMIIGSLIFLGGLILFTFAKDFYWFLGGYSLMGFGSAMKQGADHALLYEGMKNDKEEKNFKKTVGRLDFYTNIFWAIAAVSGGILYVVNERLPFYAEIVLVAIGIIILITAKEPEKEKKHFPIPAQVKASMKKAFKTPNFSKIFLFSALIGSIALTTFQYLQPLYKSLEINEAYFGLLAAAAMVVRGIGSWSAEKVGKMFSIDKYMVLHASIFGLFLILIQRTSMLVFVFAIIGVFYFLRGLYGPTVSTYINDKVDSSNRATMLSVNSQFLMLISSGSLFFTGYIANKYDLPTAFFAISIASMTFLILYVLSLRTVEAD